MEDKACKSEIRGAGPLSANHYPLCTLLGRATVVIWIGLALGLGVFSYLYPWSHTVYPIYSRACRRWWSGEDMYFAVGTDYFRYSPLFAIAATPFAFLPDSWGGALWRVFSCAVYAAGLWAWLRACVPARCIGAQAAALFLLVLPLSAPSMYNGQANVIMLGVMLFGLAAAAQRRWNRAACWLALATLIKGYPIALALLLAALYPRRFPLRFAAALAAGLLLPFAAGRPETVIGQYSHWFAHLQDSTTIMRERLRSLDHVFAVYNHSVSPQAFLLLECLAGLAVLGMCLRYAQQTGDTRQQLVRTFQLFALWVVLFGPATESCTYALLAPALAWSLVEARPRPSPWLGRPILVASLLLMGPCVTDLFGDIVRNFANEHGSQPLGALLFAGYLLLPSGTCLASKRAAGGMAANPSAG